MWQRAKNVTGGGITADLNNQIHSITTRNASWTATEDCIMIGAMRMTNNTAAQVSLNGEIAVSMETTQALTHTYARVGYGNIGFAIPKGTVVTTRNASGGEYKLYFYKVAQ